MGLLDILGKGLQAMIDEVTTPESFKAGEKFEDYVRQYIFIDSHFTLVERTHDYNRNSRDYVESSLKPDFKFRDKLTKKEFYVEAKFRTGPNNGKIVWCNDKQLQRYNLYNKELPVFVIIGMGGDPGYPEFLSLLPISAAKYKGLFPNYAERFEIEVDRPILSKRLWSTKQI